MLVEFSVKNFRSIKDKVTLSLVASRDETHPNNIFTDPSGKVRLLKTAVIYGANASGKSNMINALSTMRRLIREAHKMQRGEKIDVIPFRLDAESLLSPTEFEIVFIKNNVRYIYGFSADNDRIHEEWLSQADLTSNRVASRLLFQRELQQDNTYKWSFGEYWRPKTLKLAQETISNTLFLSKAAQNNHELAIHVFDWFDNRFRTMSSKPEATSEFGFTAGLCEKDEKIKAKVYSMIRDADLGIEDFTVKSEPFLKSRQWLRIPEKARKQILNDLGIESDKATVTRVVTRHLMTDGVTDVEFDLMEDESSGTKRFYSLAGPFIHSMMNGNVLFCDELDSSLHPMLSRALIDMAHKHSDSTFQFIFTTHDCSLLDAELFRRDQVWFTEKNRSNATDLYSLWDIKPRKEENYRKGYLSGRYGAIPFIGDFSFDE